MFKDGRTDVHDEERSGRQAIAMSDDLVQSVGQKISERRRFTISELSCEFSQSSRTLFCEIITVGLGYHKYCARWVPKMFMGAHKTQRIISALTFLERYHKYGYEFPNRIMRVTIDGTWVLFVNVETIEQSKHWMNTHSPNKPKSLNKRCLPES
jgi:hypothetical protein